jgi:hypothetical protein
MDDHDSRADQTLTLLRAAAAAQDMTITGELGPFSSRLGTDQKSKNSCA